MRLRNISGSREIIEESSFVFQDDRAKEQKGLWKKVFGNEYPVHIEIGMGKGRFIMDMAKTHPEINYIGIEKYSSVLLRAVQKMKELENPLENIRFIRMDAEEINEVFEENEIYRIYLNFSDPWPKDRHARRRLPSKEFLARYDKVLNQCGCVEFKTDNKELFLFALGELETAGWEADRLTFNLHEDEEMMRGNIMTEYEEKFSSMGNPIYKYIIQR